MKSITEFINEHIDNHVNNDKANYEGLNEIVEGLYNGCVKDENDEIIGLVTYENVLECINYDTINITKEEAKQYIDEKMKEDEKQPKYMTNEDALTDMPTCRLFNEKDNSEE